MINDDELLQIGSERIFFGKYTGKTLFQIYFWDNQYFYWLQSSNIKFKKNIREFLDHVVANGIEFEIQKK